MANIATYQQIETKVLTDLELLDETFIQGGVGSEVMAYCNEAIHVAESLIMQLCEDYFKTYAYLALVDGQVEYDLPSDIYADKIRRIIYSNGSLIYRIKKMFRSYSELDIEFINVNPGIQLYSHMIINKSTGRKINLFPTPKETSSTHVKIWYIRSANRVSAVTDSVEIPEFHLFIEKYMKMMCLQKEGHPGLAMAKAEMEQEKQLMITSLSEREPDEDTTIEQDTSFYMEHL